jgi:hypothetical protein
MPTVIEPIGAGLVVALINKFIINNRALWLFLCPEEVEREEHENECTNSSTTSINDESVHVHHFDPWMHT